MSDETIVDQLRRLERNLSDLRRIIEGDPSLRSPSMLERLDNIQDNVTRLSSDISRLQLRNHAIAAISAAGFLLGFLAIWALLALQVAA